jgi:phosphatidylinositol alpha-1,6-mannosyltransferase
MNILFLSDCFLPHAGGSRVYYYNLYSRWAAAYPDRVTLLTKKVPGWESFDRSTSQGSLRIIRRFRPLPDLSAKHLPKILFPLAEAIGRALCEKIDMVHSGDLYPQGVISLWLKRMFGIPYLAFCHGEDITLTENRRYQRGVRNRIYLEADAVVAACEFARQNLLSIGIPENRIVKITPGVDWERFTPGPKSETLMRRYGLENQRVLLTVARLMPRKGHATVLRALAKALPGTPDTTYLIVGTGPEREPLERLAAELGISSKVRFVGYVAEEELCDYYNLSDVFVMMNQEQDGDIEGFGMVFLEANAVGKPVLGGRSGGTADSIEHGVTGYRIIPGDVDELASYLDLLLKNDELRGRLGEAGLRRARSDFSWRTRAEKLRETSVHAIERARGPNQGRRAWHLYGRDLVRSRHRDSRAG